MEQIQNKHVCQSSFAQSYDIEEQKSQYYSLLDSNHEHLNKLQDFLTPDYEYFQSAQETTILESYKDVANDATPTNSCNGIIYDIFYHKEQNIDRSARALLLVDNNFDNGSLIDDGNMFSHDDPFSQASMLVNNFEKNEDENKEETIFYKDEKALLLLENQGSIDKLVIDNKDNNETKYLPPLIKALSPISKLVKNKYSHEKEKESCLTREYEFLLNDNDKSLNNGIANNDLASRNVNNGNKSTLKLNLRYLHQGLDFKTPDRPNLDPIQSYIVDGKSTSSSIDGSRWTSKCSTTNSSTPHSFNISPAWMSGFENLDSRPLVGKRSKLSRIDFSTIKGNDKRSIITERRKLLSARVKKLDIKKQIYLSRVLDKLENAQVTGSVDLGFCIYTPHSKESMLT